MDADVQHNELLVEQEGGFPDIQVYRLPSATRLLIPHTAHQIFCNADFLTLSFSSPQQALSSAILMGGNTTVQSILNLRVDAAQMTDEPAQQTLQVKAQSLGLAASTIGMMTAASMNSVRLVQAKSADVLFTILISSGLGNARRAGDKADMPEFEPQQTDKHGTINIILLLNKPLSSAAQVEAIMMITEAKACALQQLQVKSPISGLTASGTGTDSCAVICPEPDTPVDEIPFVGKHLHLGQQLSRAVISAVKSASAYELEGC